MRNYLMAIATIINGGRSSNLMHMKVEDILKAKEDELGFHFLSEKYKTCLPAKTIWLPTDLYLLYKAYIKYIRVILTPLSSPYMFTSLSGKGGIMTQSVICNALTTSFKKAAVILPVSKRISPSRIRCGCLTELVCVQEADVEEVAPEFMKHRPSTARKFYLMHHQNREAIFVLQCFLLELLLIIKCFLSVIYDSNIPNYLFFELWC